MARHIMYCVKCDRFTMKASCSVCSGEVISTIPAKFSPEDKWGKYRQMAKRDINQ